VGLGDHAAALRLRGLREAALVDQEGGLLLRPRDDPLRLFLGLLDDPLALGIDALRRADLLGDRDAQLVDEPERGVLIDDDVGGQRQLLAVRDQRLEALDEEDDVDGSCPPAWAVPVSLRLRAGSGRLWHGPGRRRQAGGRNVGGSAAGQRRPIAAARAAAAEAGSMAETSPPKLAISLTRLELT
jgi:hypothetical protein